MNTDIKKIAIGIGLFGIAMVAIIALFTDPVKKANTILTHGHFKNIEKTIYRNQASYEIYIQERGEYFKIGAEWAECFNYEAFLEEIKKGYPITIGVSKNQLFLSPSVVSVMAFNKDYINRECINQDIANSKVWLPLCGIGGCIIIIVIYFLEKNKHRKTHHK